MLIIGLVIILALLSCVLLLIFDLPQPFLHRLVHAPVSAAPLLLIGLASLSFQLVIRPKPLELFKAFIVSSAFILWGVAQLFPTGWIATILDDVVIVLFVVDLGWMMLERLTQKGWLSQVPPAEAIYPLQVIPLPPPTKKGSETGTLATSAPFHLSTPEAQLLQRGSPVVRARNTPLIRPIHLRAFQDTSAEDTASHHVCSCCGKPREHACCSFKKSLCY